MAALTAYRADCRTTHFLEDPRSGKPPKTWYELSTLTAVKPNRMRYDGWIAIPDATGALRPKYPTPQYVFACDGKTNIRQLGSLPVQQTAARPESLHTIEEPWTGFYDRANSEYSRLRHFTTATFPLLECLLQRIRKDNTSRLVSLRQRPGETVDGAPCTVVTYAYRNVTDSGWWEFTETLYIGPDRLIRRQVETVAVSTRPGLKLTRDAVLKNIRTNFPAPPPRTFTYTPPKGIIQLRSSTPGQSANRATRGSIGL